MYAGVHTDVHYVVKADVKIRSLSPNNSVANTGKVTTFYSIFVLGLYLTTGLKHVPVALQSTGSRCRQPEANIDVVWACTETDSIEWHHTHAQVGISLPGFCTPVVIPDKKLVGKTCRTSHQPNANACSKPLVRIRQAIPTTIWSGCSTCSTACSAMCTP